MGTGSLVLLISDIKRIGFINFLLTLPLIGATVWISLLAYRAGNFSNILLTDSDPFFAFGVFIFAFTGLVVIADARDVFSGMEKVKQLKSAILLGTAIPLVLYAVFVVAVLMASGTSITKDALFGLTGVLGRQAILLGALIGVLSMFTSYLALGYDLKKVYELDANVKPFLAWVLVASVPLILFVLGLRDFIKLISVAGGLFVAIDGIIVVFILRSMKRRFAGGIKFIQFGSFYQVALVSIFVASVIYELVYQIF